MLRFRALAPLLLPTALLGGTQPTLRLDPGEDEAGFANPELLVTTAWLAEHGSDDGVVIVDVRGDKEVEVGHVPGAVSIATSATYDPASRGNIGPASQIAALLGASGIAASTHVVVYDGGKSTSAARFFWTLEVYGHGKVSVLDGGFPKWQAEEREVTHTPTEVTPVEYAIGPRSEKCSTRDQLLEGVDDPEVVMLDARSDREFGGGRIPAAVHIEWSRNYTSDEIAVFKSPSELRKLYSDQGVTRDKRVHAY